MVSGRAAGRIMKREVRIEDARGCWTLYACDPAEPSLRLKGQSWEHLLFHATGETLEGRPVYRSHEPAIGPRGRFIDYLHLPDGWHPPGVA